MSDKETIKDKVTYIGKVDYRNKELTFGIKERDRPLHTYIIGKTGMGKSTLLENLAIQDINNGEGLCVIDPHGSLAERMLDYIPESRVKDVVYFAPFDDKHPVGLNVLEKVEPNKRHLVANGLMSGFKKTFTDSDGKSSFSARMEYILNNIILALLENEDQTLLGVNRMLTDKEYRNFIVSNITDPTVKDFWINEYANYTERFAQEAAPAIQNKVGQFVANPLIRNIIGQKKTSFNIRELMDNKKILIVNLSKGKVGEGNANLLGSLLITKIYLAAMSRADAGPYELEKLPPFYFYVDEFQNFANESFASILSEARKYNLALTVAHQYIDQMTDEVKSAVFGNVGTMIAFRVGATDAEIFEKEFAPYFILDDIVNLSAFQIYLRLMINGVGSKPFSARTLPLIQKPAKSYAQAVIANSRQLNSRPVAEVEEEIAQFYKPIAKEVRPLTPPPNEVKIREIKNDTPLPVKKYETRVPHTVAHAVPSEAFRRSGEAYSRNGGAFERSGVNTKYEAVRKDSQYISQNTNFVKKEENKVYNDQDPRRTKIETNHKTFPEKFNKINDDQVTEVTRKEIKEEKPKSSLKEALERAMAEYGQKTEDREQMTDNRKQTTDDTKQSIQDEGIKVHKEVAEDVLRKLIQEES